jgi:Polyketide cyclase / dehydrase and lipid transport
MVAMDTIARFWTRSVSPSPAPSAGKLERRPTILPPVAVDVETEIDIASPRVQVATYACDPDNATEWYENIKKVEWKTPRPLFVGSRIAFVASFLGRSLAYTYEVTDLVPGERLVMRTTEGPFPMETTYTWRDAGEGSTRMTLRNRGEPAGFARVGAPLMARAMRRANRKDLSKLKEILERR